MTDEKIIEYVMNSPENTNPSVLSSMLKSKSTGIKTVVIKNVVDKTTGSIVYTPNMTYEEARDMMLNLEPFNVCLIIGIPPNDPRCMFFNEVRYDVEHNRIVLSVSNSSTAIWWTAAGFGPAGM